MARGRVATRFRVGPKPDPASPDISIGASARALRCLDRQAHTPPRRHAMTDSAQTTAQEPTPPSPVARPMAQLWQVPALVLGLVMLVGSITLSIKTAPKPDVPAMLTVAETLITDRHYEPALEYLNDKIRPYVGAGALDDHSVQRFHRARAMAISLGQRQLGVSVRSNHESIIGEYRRAEALGAILTPEEIHADADSCIALGLLDRAMDRAKQLSESAPDRQTLIVRGVLFKRLSDPGLDHLATLRLLAQFLADPTLSLDDRAWAEARQAEVLILHGYAQDATRRLLRGLPAYLDADPLIRAELYLLLGRAYLAAGSPMEATPHLERALSLMPEYEPLRADVTLYLAEAAQAQGDIETARTLFREILMKHAASSVELSALRGLGDVEAMAREDEAAFDAMGRLVLELRKGRSHPDLSHERIVEQLLRVFADRFASRETEAALRYATLAEELTGPDAAPPRLLLALADANRRLADELIEAADGFENGRLVLRRIDPATREQVRQRLLAAGRSYRLAADRLVLSDASAYADALWLAGDCFDRAGDQDSAVLAFSEYASSFTNDPRQAEARFRLAQSHQAKGDYVVAAEYYSALIDERSGTRASPFADLSHVPLAQCFLLGAQATGDEDLSKRAEDILLFVVNGGLGNPESPQFAEALLQLGELTYGAGRYDEAIRRLEEALLLLRNDSRASAIRYKLADSHRLEAASLAQQILMPMPDWERRGKDEARRTHLARAIELFQQVRNALSAGDATRLSLAERLYLRNAHFYLGDCAFDLGDYESAIRHYDAARERHPRDPASLVAMTQIVNAYLAQGDKKRAWTANERAKRFYASLPPTVWDDPGLPMSDRDWVRWLEASAKLADADMPARSESSAVSAGEPR